MVGYNTHYGSINYYMYGGNLPLSECPSPAKNVTIILLYPFKRIEVEHDKTALYLCIYSAEWSANPVHMLNNSQFNCYTVT